MKRFVANLSSFARLSPPVPTVRVGNLGFANQPRHVAQVAQALRESGILKISLQFTDDTSQYLHNMLLSLHKHHGHGLPITHSASHGWFWDVRPNPITFQSQNYQARSETMQEFPWHTDCSYEESPPRFFALQVLQPDRCGGGTLSVMNVERLSHLLSATATAALIKPHFRIAIPPEFIKKDNQCHIISNLMAASKPGRPAMVRFREDIVTPLNHDAAAGLAELRQCLRILDRRENALHLTPEHLPRGSILIMDNSQWMHARNAVQDPDRHLRRVRWDARPFPGACH
ncbi:uncharacterized protein N7503_000391 [Penicillium pulvis]|uniref:uncharacterized protein n=1 Tax=Penicillium pulvis TaxID=1562058 RepID=UPI00254865DE|nr:uncharacterized protein N7503_000391 [Penicillium pulvis]KAJ5813641.1 hypothetical protein N7503_000391 [Penicillium pulvis]